MLFRKLIFILLTLVSMQVAARVVNYEFDIDTKQVNISGEPVTAMTIDSGIPGPTIEANVGDILRVTFNNRMQVESSIHWHGVLLPNDQDGVPYLTTPPIKAGSSFTYEFPITHSGTYWYHSHTGLQEQRGLYGSLIFRNPQEQYQYDAERVIVVSDWIDENPKQVLRNLKREDDYYALKKNAVQSWQGVLENGWPAFRHRLNSSLMRMSPMDISDVGYDAFLINGLPVQQDSKLKAGDRVRLRIINAAASSYFYLDYAGGDMTLIEADGMPVEPLKIKRIKMAVAETYDVIITIPEDNKAYELRATSEDITGYASYFAGDGQPVDVADYAPPNLYLIDHSMHGEHKMMEGHDSHAMKDMPVEDAHHAHHHNGENNPEKIIDTLNNYRELRSPTRTAYNENSPQRVVALTLTGSMERYIWSFNNKILTESDRILIKKGEVVRFVLKNETMMHHPIHLHGHFFRVLNGQGDFSPLKHTVNVPPFETVTIEFLANEEKDWFFHCHNLYHMKSGMSRVIAYDEPGKESFKETEFYKQVKKNGDPWFSFADPSFQSNMLAGEIWSMNTRNTFKVHYDYDYDSDFEIEGYYMRHPSRYLGLFGGFEIGKEDDEKHNVATLGIHYVLPLLVETELRYDSEGQFRFQVMNEHQLTKHISFDWFWNTDHEYRVQLRYEINKRFSAVVNHDSDYDAGAGIEIAF